MGQIIQLKDVLVPVDRTPMTRDFYNLRYAAFVNAINSVGTRMDGYDAAVTNLVSVGLQRINDTLGPLLTVLQSAAQTGFLVASADGLSKSLTAGVDVEFDITSVGKEIFTPTPFLLAVDDTDSTNWGILSLTAYSGTTGVLAAHCVSASKTAASSSWTISANSALIPSMATMLSQATSARDAAVAANASVEGIMGDLNALVAAVQAGPVATVAGRTGAIVLAISDIIGLVDALASKASITAMTAGLGSKQDSSSILASLAGLSLAADKLIYATGVGTLSTSALTAFARTILAAADAPTARAALGLAAPNIVTIADAVGPTFDAQNGLSSLARLVASNNRTLVAPLNPVDGQKVMIEHTASGAARTLGLTTGAAGTFSFGSDVTALTATVSGKTDRVGVIYNLAAARWFVVGYAKGF